MADDPNLDRFTHTLSDLDGPKDPDEREKDEDAIGEMKEEMERNERE